MEAPLNAVLDGKAMVEYDRLFHHLWRLKRVESALTQGWMRVTSNSRLFEGIQSMSLYRLGLRCTELIVDLRRPWHDSRQLQAQMVHFLRQLQAFCQLEVIECSWQSLMDFTDKREGDLDALIAAHRTYLDRVVRKVLLLGSKRDKQVSLFDPPWTEIDQVGDHTRLCQGGFGYLPKVQRCHCKLSLSEMTKLISRTTSTPTPYPK
jgi:gamma-tubulin complex component 3